MFWTTGWVVSNSPRHRCLSSQRGFVYRFWDTNRTSRKNAERYFRLSAESDHRHDTLLPSKLLSTAIKTSSTLIASSADKNLSWKSSCRVFLEPGSGNRLSTQATRSVSGFASRFCISVFYFPTWPVSWPEIPAIYSKHYSVLGGFLKHWPFLLPSQHNSLLTWHCLVTTKRHKLNKYWPNYGNSEITRKHCCSANKQISSTHNRYARDFSSIHAACMPFNSEFTWQSIADINSRS